MHNFTLCFCTYLHLKHLKKDLTFAIFNFSLLIFLYNNFQNKTIKWFGAVRFQNCSFALHFIDKKTMLNSPNLNKEVILLTRTAYLR